LPARSALSFRKSTYPRTTAWRFCWSRLSCRPSLAAARPLMSAGLRSRSAATTASPPAAYTFGASGASAVSAKASVRSAGIGGSPGSVAVCRTEGEGRIGKRLHAADTRNLIGRGEGRRFFDRPPGRCLGERLAAHDGAPVALRLLAREFERLLAAQRLDDLVAHGVERLHVAGLVLLYPDDVEAEGLLDDVAHLARLELEGGALERRRHGAAAEEAEVASLRGGARV